MKRFLYLALAMLIILPDAHAQVERRKPQRARKPIRAQQVETPQRITIQRAETYDVPDIEIDARKLDFKLYAVKLAPQVEIATEPMEGGDIVYHYLPGWTAQDKKMAQVSVSTSIKNKETKAITLQKVRYEYSIKGNNYFKEVNTGNIVIGANQTKSWQNGRDYHELGDVLYFESGIPSSLTIKLYFSEYPAPVAVSQELKAYPRAFGLPFKAKDLDKDEYWESASTHGGGSQVFAYDMGVYRYGNGKWSKYKDDGSSNSDYYIWGKPIYAMADGIVKGYNNNVPTNPKPGEKADFSKYERGGAGNHFYIQHGDVIALYAHMQKGSLNDALMQEGKTVKKGDFLGLAGNSGNSTNPHLHIHIRKETEIETGPFRPLLFNEGYTIGRDDYTKPLGNINWSELNKQGIPGKVKTRSFIWPSEKHPYCEYSSNPKEISKHGVSSGKYQEVFNSIYTCGYYPVWVDGFEVNGSTYFNLSFRKDDGKPWVARHNLSASAYQSEFNEWAGKGYRLINVDCYVLGGQVRYAAVWKKDGGPAVAAYHGVSANTHQSKFNELTSNGWVPVNVSSVHHKGNLYITAIYEKKNVGGFYHHFGMSASAYQSNFGKYDQMGYKMVYLNAYDINGSPRFNAIWYKSAPFGNYVGKHGMSFSQYQSDFNYFLGKGFETYCVTGYQDGNSGKYGALWVK